jgi:hypothetical protein
LWKRHPSDGENKNKKEKEMAFKVKIYFEYFMKGDDEEKTDSVYAPFPFSVDGYVTMLKNGDLRFYGEVKNYVYWVFSMYLSPNANNGKRDVTMYYKKDEEEFSVCFIEGETCFFEFINGDVKHTGTVDTMEITDNMTDEGGTMNISAKFKRALTQCNDIDVKIECFPMFDA